MNDAAHSNTHSARTTAAPTERPDPPGAAPRDGKPPRIVLDGGPGLWACPLFMVLILIAGTIGQLRGAEFPLLGIVVFALASIGTAVTWAWRRADVRVWREGRVIQGEITKGFLKSSGTGESRTTHSYVRYRYTVEGVDHERRRRVRMLANPQPVWVVYDPGKPHKSMPVW